MKSKKLKIVAFLIIAIGLIGFGGYYYVMHGGARDLASEEATFTVSSKEISDEFTANVEVANKKYLEKAIAITGIITSVNKTEVILDNTIICNFISPDTSIKVGETISVKGRVVGFDDLMGELKLDQCLKSN